MIGITIENNKVLLNFWGESFVEIHEYVKKHMDYKYDPTKQKWIGTARELYHHKENLEDIDIIKIYEPDKLNDLYKLEPKNETEFFNKNPSRNIFVYPPIKGKQPYGNFQIESIRKGISRNRLGYFLEMGLGKSYITITVLNELYQSFGVDAVVVIAPPSGIYNWRRELLKFSTWIKEDNILISQANSNRNPFDMDLTNITVIVMTYRHYLTLSDEWYKKETGKNSKNYRTACIPWATWGNKRAIVLDESHNIKNIKARQSKVIHMHKDSFEFRYILTGTPTPNNFTEIYNQINFLDTKIINKSYWNWIREIADTGNRFSDYTVNYIYPEKKDFYEKKFAPWIIRYKAKDVLELPELYIKPIYAQLTDIQKQIYQTVVNDTIYVIREDNNGRLVPKLLRQRFPYISMAYENPLLLTDKFSKNSPMNKLINKFKFEENHGKIEICDDLVNEYIHNEKNKVTLFDFHPKTIDLLAEHYKRYNPIIIYGDTKDREEKLELFRKSKSHNMLIASFRVLATSVNLVECNRVIYFSRDYSYLNWSQSIKRFHRIGQESRVIINPLIFEDTLDEYIENVILKKKDLDEKIFQGDDFTKSDWKNIFTGKVP